MTTPEAAALGAALKASQVLTTDGVHSFGPMVATWGEPDAIIAALHDAGYALTPLAPEVPPRRELPPDFPIFGVGNRRIPGVDRHDRCSIHGEIGLHTSIAAHLLAAHGMTYEQYGTLAELYGVRDRDLYDEEDAAATRTPEPPDSGPWPSIDELRRMTAAEANAFFAAQGVDWRVRAEPPDSGDGAGIDAALLAEALPDALSAMTEGDEETPAPQPSDEPGSPYVVGLARALAARLRSGSPAPEGGE